MRAPDPIRPGLPSELQVEVTGSCNLRCRMCLVRYRDPISRSSGALDYETYLELLDALPTLRKLTLQGLGEPLLSPHIFEMVEHATARGVEVGFNTNATLLTRERSERLVAAGLGWAHVSLDGASAETYEGVREGARFDRVRANLEGLLEARAAAGASRPRILLVFVAMRRNIGDLDDLVRLAAGWRVDGVWVQNLSHSFSDTDPAGDYAEIREFAAAEALWAGDPAFGRAARLAGELGVDLRLPRREEATTRACSWPWESAYVTHRGEVQPCCMVMGSERAKLGRLGERSFGEIWTSDEYARFRAGLLDGRPHAVCDGCSLYRGVF